MSAEQRKWLQFADVVAELEVPASSSERLVDGARAKVQELASWLAEQAVKLP